MKISCLHRAIMNRDGGTVEEAQNYIMYMRDKLISGMSAEEILQEEGFELDLVFDLLY